MVVPVPVLMVGMVVLTMAVFVLVVGIIVVIVAMFVSVVGMVMFTMAVFVPVVVEVLLVLAVHGDGDVRAHDAALGRALHSRVHAGDAQTVELIYEALPLALGQQLQQGGHEHVARHAHAAVQIKYLHASPHRWFIMLAR